MKKGILITGALGGLGRALVEAAGQIDDVDYIIAGDISRGILNAYDNEIRIKGMVMDVASELSIETLRENVHSLGVSIKYIVNNAGKALFFPISEASEDQLDKIVKVNTYGPVLTVSAFLDDLIENKGRVVQISSDNVRLSGAFQPYASSKIALESFSVAMRQELSLHDIKLIMIRPGAIRTGLLDAIGEAEIRENSRYVGPFSTFKRFAGKGVGKTIDPGKVALLVMKALKARHPKTIYSINKTSTISFLTKFPHKWIDKLIRKTLLSK